MASSSDETADSFTERIFRIATDAHLSLSMAMGVRTGLWEAMAKWDQPKTSAEIAEATGLKERSLTVTPKHKKMASSSDETADSFTERIFRIATDAHLSLSMAMGVRTGLWEAMAKWDQPKTSAEIAEATGLKERYVREWLGGMVTGNIVELSTDSVTDKFLLPPHRRRALTKEGGTDNVAFYSLSVPALAEVFTKIEKCCEINGPKGVSYSDYSDLLWASIGGMTEALYKEHLLTNIIPAVTGMTDALNNGACVLEIGCGTGVPSLRIAAAFPNCSVLATDYSDEPLNILSSKATEQSLNNISVEKQDASKLPSDWTSKFDYVVAHDMVHDTAQPAAVLNECNRVLKLDGTFVMIDINMHSKTAQNIGNPYSPLLYNFSLLNCMPVSLYHDGMGLGNAWGVEKAIEMTKAAGFPNVTLSQVPEGGLHMLYICKKK